MKKWIFGLLVLTNGLFFAVMYWGSALTVDANNPSIQPSLNAEKMTLISAQSAVMGASAPVVATSAVVEARAIPISTSTSSTPTKLVCMEWGEFSATDLVRVEKSLATLKLNDKLKQRHVDYSSGYWVYMPPMKSKALVDQKIAQLKKMDIHDYFAIQEAGAWQNAISLGVFKTEDAAKKYLAKLQDRGVRSATVGERTSKLKYTVLLFNRLDSTLAAQLSTLAKNFSEGELKQVSCN